MLFFLVLADNALRPGSPNVNASWPILYCNYVYLAGLKS